jgi:hypothetical protein
MNASLVLSGLESTAITATTEARARRDELLVLARKGKAVNSPESATRAAALLTDLKGFTRMVEAGRSDVKAPVLDLGKRIDGLARELTADLEAEAGRISRLLGAYQAEENRKAEEARQRAYQEEQRIRREADEKERQAKEAAEREQRELAAKAERARTEGGRARAEAEARLAQERADREAQERADQERAAIVETRVAVAAATPAKPAGVATRPEVCYEVTDLTALYEAAPYLVTLTPNVSAIKAALKGLTGEQKLPGVKHWIEQRAIVR